jgi:hypothetical protein
MGGPSNSCLGRLFRLSGLFRATSELDKLDQLNRLEKPDSRHAPRNGS